MIFENRCGDAEKHLFAQNILEEFFYCAKFSKKITDVIAENNGAGEGDRTLVTCLGSKSSTIELHPHVECGADSSTDKISKVITITINGEIRQFQQSINLTTLVEEMGLTGKRIALERNGEIVPRSTFNAQQLSEGDKIEIVVAVGGG